MSLNPDTAVAVFGYNGDAHQILTLLPYYLHHKCPVVVFSPTDAPIHRTDSATLKFRHGGRRAYIGQESLDRQVIHMKMLLREFPQKYFLFNDSDSVCLSPKIPAHLYNDIVWSNEVSDAMHDHKRADDYPWPHLAFQPPYFLSRENVQAWIDAADTVKADPNTPFLDWAFMAWTIYAKLRHAQFADPHGASIGVSCPTRGYDPGTNAMENAVRHHRAIFLHSIKDKQALLKMAYARLACKKIFKL
jgi:hypothetical protein